MLVSPCFVDLYVCNEYERIKLKLDLHFNWEEWSAFVCISLLAYPVIYTVYTLFLGTVGNTVDKSSAEQYQDQDMRGHYNDG